MSQADLGTLDPTTTDGTELAGLLTAWRTAVHSAHKGDTRPTYAVTGMLWIDDAASPWTLKIYDGTEDVPLGTIDPTTHAFTPDAGVDTGLITGQLIVSGSITPTQLAANVNDYNPTGLDGASVVNLSADAERTITGMAGGSDGRVLIFPNVGSQPIVLPSENASSQAANRFAFSHRLQPGETLISRFDGAVSRWRPIALFADTTRIGAGKQSIWIPAGSMTSRTTNGAAVSLGETTTNKVMRRSLNFDPTTQEFAQFQIAAPKSWDEGTVTYQVYWSHSTTTVNFGVAWDLQALALSNDDSLETAFGTAVEVADTGGTASDIYITAESGALTIAGTPAEGDLLVFQVSRDVADGDDTMVIDANLLGIMLFYTTTANTDG